MSDKRVKQRYDSILTFKVMSEEGAIIQIVDVQNGMAVLDDQGTLEITTYPSLSLESSFSVMLKDPAGNEFIASATLSSTNTHSQQASANSRCTRFLATWPHDTLQIETCST